ncbi:thioesterase II family protein [Spirosoma radiotolerans]|nr:thioesterase domain-containing protein [Spirosoma radiotolerans]
MKKMTVFCFPFAGGNKYSYRDMVNASAQLMDMVVLEPPGRGARMNEPLLTSLDEIVEDGYNQLVKAIDWNHPYAIYGHSMGATVGYLVTRRLIKAGLPQPIHLFFTGRPGPSVGRSGAPSYLLDDAEFIERVQRLGGLPDEILNEKDLMDFYMPILKADFHALDRFVYAAHQTPLDIPMDVIIGMQEDIMLEQALAWKKESSAAVSVKQLPGNHFFIHQQIPYLLKMMTSKLMAFA